MPYLRFYIQVNFRRLYGLEKSNRGRIEALSSDVEPSALIIPSGRQGTSEVKCLCPGIDFTHNLRLPNLL